MMQPDRATVVVALLLAVTLSGCAHRSGVPASSGSGSGASPGVGVSACTGDPGTTRLVLTEADNGSWHCLSAAGVVELYLHGTATDRWSPVLVTGTGLRVAPSGKGALPIGVTAGFFAGTGPGQAQLSAFRSPCVAADAVSPGCDSTHLIRITVVLR